MRLLKFFRVTFDKEANSEWQWLVSNQLLANIGDSKRQLRHGLYGIKGASIRMLKLE